MLESKFENELIDTDFLKSRLKTKGPRRKLRARSTTRSRSVAYSGKEFKVEL